MVMSRLLTMEYENWRRIVYLFCSRKLQTRS